MAQTVGQLRIEFVASTSQLQGQINDLQKKLDGFGKSTSSGFKSGTSSIRDMSAAVRALEGGFDVRSLARFLAQSKELRIVAQGLLPAFAGLAIIELFGKMSAAVAAFQKRVEEAPQKAREGFQNMLASQQESIDKIDVANDKLDIQIAKIEHKPINAMKLAMDETKEAADRLAISLQGDIQKMNELLDKTQVSAWDQFKDTMVNIAEAIEQIGSGNGFSALNNAILAAQQGNSDLSKTVIERQNAQIDTKQAAVTNVGHHIEAARATGDTALVKSLTEQQTEQVKDLNQTMQQILRDRQSAADLANKQGFGHAHDASNFQQAGDALQNRIWQNIADNANAQGQARLATDEANKEATAKMIEDTKKKWEASIKAIELVNKDSVINSAKAVSDFWMLMAGATQNAILKQFADNNYATTRVEYEHKSQEVAKSDREEVDRGHKGTGELQTHLYEEDKKHFEALQSLTDLQQSLNDKIQDIQQKANNALQEQAIQYQEATGQISRHTAALDMLNLHTEEYNQTIATLSKQLEAAKALADGTDAGNARSAHIQATIIEQINTVQANRPVQHQADVNQVNNTQQTNEATNALNLWTQSALDSGKKLAELVTSTLDSLNNDILSGHAKGFQQTGKSLLQGFGKIGLDNVEGRAMQALGIKTGKLGSNSSNPMYTKDVDKKNGASGAHTTLPNGNDPLGILGKMMGIGGSSESNGVNGPGGIGSFFRGTFNNGITDPDSDGGTTSTGASKGGFGGFLGSIWSMISGRGGSGGGGSAATGTDGAALDDFSGFGFADGGDPPIGQASIVGEEGPELVVPKRASTVIPNGKFGGGDTHVHNWQNNDFSHTDPHMVQKQIMAAAPQIAGAAVKAISEGKARMPPSRSK